MGGPEGTDDLDGDGAAEIALAPADDPQFASFCLYSFAASVCLWSTDEIQNVPAPADQWTGLFPLFVYDVDGDGEREFVLYAYGTSATETWVVSTSSDRIEQRLDGAALVAFADVDGDGSRNVLFQIGGEVVVVPDANPSPAAPLPAVPVTLSAVARPNPAASSVTVDVAGGAGPATVEVFDGLGRRVFRGGGDGPGPLSVGVPTAPLAAGPYTYRVARGGRSITGRFVVAR